jgi:dihydropyrimidinase
VTFAVKKVITSDLIITVIKSNLISTNMKILIKNGNIVTSTDNYFSDILITDGIINRIESGINISNPDRVIDAKGHFIFPGGVDPHVHMHLPTPAGYSSDDFLSGSKAALYGGTTTLLDFVTPKKGQSLTEALMLRKEEAKDSLTDFSFHVTPVEWSDSTEQEINDCISEGVTSFKVYMAYRESIGLSDNDVFNVMKAVGKAGGIVTVHCESGDEIDKLRNKYSKEHNFSPLYHALSRPVELEAAAVKTAIELANQANCALYIVHVSAKQSLKHILDARFRGQKVFSETCPQYLLLDDSKYKGDFIRTAPYIISPPLRKKEDKEALWDAVSKGTINTVGTDHCPFFLSQKEAGLNDFRKIPNGAGGVEHRLELLFTYGVLDKRITLTRMVDLFSTMPAKIFGLYPAKGDIIVGSDADLVIWNPDRENKISAKTNYQNCDNSIYEGITTKGVAEYVIASGRIAIEKGKMADSLNCGKFLKRNIEPR